MEFTYVMRLWRALISRFVLTSVEVRGLKNYLSLVPFSALPLHPKLPVGFNLFHQGEGKYMLSGHLTLLNCAMMHSEVKHRLGCALEMQTVAFVAMHWLV